MRLSDTIARVAQSNATVLIEGETGTGKTTAAREIHKLSARSAEPFTVFDCAAVAPTLLESALFGHERGAFTGASDVRIGALETAQAGTLFIDEVTDLALDLQPKLLRALEEREFSRVGSPRVIAFSARVIVASQLDLLERVKQGRFRQDLYFRLAVVKLELPPLRAHKKDIPSMIDALFQDVYQSSKRFAALPKAVRAALVAHDWPGNMRELRNAVERLTVLDDDAWHPPAATRMAAPASDALDYELPFHEFKERMLALHEKTYVQKLIERSGGNVTRAAQAGKMNRRYLYELLEKYGLR